jgi:branched-chain amino acid transport system substrate-binding protein
MNKKKLLALIVMVVMVSGLAYGMVAPTQAQDEEPIRVGGSLSLTGFLSATGIIHQITGQAFVDNLNANGGLLGRPVEWVLLDDESSPDNAAALYERLITEDEVDLLMGPYGTGNITAAMNVAERYGMVFPHHTASLTYAYTYEYHFPSWSVGVNTHITTNNILFDALESVENPPQTIAFVVNEFPGTQFLAFGHESVDPGGAIAIAEERGFEVVLVTEFPTVQPDFGPIAAAVRDADPDFLWMGALGVDGPNLITAMEALDYSPPGMFFMWPAPGPLVALGEPAEGSLSVTLFEEQEPFLSYPQADVMVELFHEGAEEAGLPYTKVETQSAASWAAWQILVAGVEGCGCLDQEEIGNWLLENGVSTVQGDLFFNPEENNYGPDLDKIKQIQDGEWVVVWPPEFSDGHELRYSPER